jgi:L-ascorbate metabolism protein UlaG (beta-lactamase superfamily)
LSSVATRILSILAFFVVRDSGLGSQFRSQMGRLFVVGMIVLFSMSCGSTSKANSGKPHHTRNGFRNVHPHEEHGFSDFLKWRWDRRSIDVPPPEDYGFAPVKNDPDFLKRNREQTTLTWIGHATILLQLDGMNILTDPVFSDRASPVQWAGPERVVKPGLALEYLPPIDLVVISHDHFDALDKESVIKLHERAGNQKTVFCVPLGLKSWFEDQGISGAVELDWWDEHTMGNLAITAVPVQHWSKRSVFSRNKTLWAGWVIRSSDFRFLFVGDSGYTPHFKEIAGRLGPFDLAAIPIGAYEPRWFMHPHHLSPEEAVQTHLDVRSKKSVAIHWGTFILTDEPLDEPPKRLEAAKKAKGLSDEEFVALGHGETIILNESSP